MIWTEERQREARRLFAQGLTAAQVAAAMGPDATPNGVQKAANVYGLRPGAHAPEARAARVPPGRHAWSEESLTERWADRRKR